LSGNSCNIPCNWFPEKYLILKNVNGFSLQFKDLIIKILIYSPFFPPKNLRQVNLSKAVSLLIQLRQRKRLYILINTIIGIWNLFRNSDLLFNRGLWLNLELFMVCRGL